MKPNLEQKTGKPINRLKIVYLKIKRDLGHYYCKELLNWERHNNTPEIKKITKVCGEF